MSKNIDIQSQADLLSNIDKWAERYQLKYLLSFHDDGVVWGKWDRKWIFSHTPFPDVSPPLLYKTLQQVRIFGPEAEILITRFATGEIKGSVLEESNLKELNRMDDEDYLLWGTDVLETREGFTLLQEGQQGFHHAVPLTEVTIGEGKRLSLKVRHYIDYKEDHHAYVKYSRLVDLVGGK